MIEKADQLLAELDKHYIFGNPVHDRGEVFEIASSLGLDRAATEELVDILVDRGKIRVCYPEIGKEPYRLDDWYLERCE